MLIRLMPRSWSTRANGQAVDIIAAAGEQPDHAGEHAGLVIDQHRDDRGAKTSVFCRHQTSIMPSLVMLAGAFGVLRAEDHLVMGGRPRGSSGSNFPLWSTAMSAITGPGMASISRITPSSSPTFFARRPGRMKAFCEFHEIRQGGAIAFGIA